MFPSLGSLGQNNSSKNEIPVNKNFAYSKLKKQFDRNPNYPGDTCNGLASYFTPIFHASLNSINNKKTIREPSIKSELCGREERADRCVCILPFANKKLRRQLAKFLL
jgi:hypothetical protein